MSEATGRAELERRLIEKSLEDESFRQRLIENPKGAVEEEVGRQLPEEVRVVTVEETAETIYLVLPSTSMVGREDVELSDQELQSVAGGGFPSEYNTEGYGDYGPQYPGHLACGVGG